MSARPAPKARITEEQAFGAGSLSLPPDVAEDGKKKGYTFRWLSASVLHKNQGHHNKGWSVYKRPAGASVVDIHFGQDPDGIVRRGDCILGYKTNEQVTLHRAYLKQKAADYSTEQRQSSLEAMRAIAREHGTQMAIEEDDGDE